MWHSSARSRTCAVLVSIALLALLSSCSESSGLPAMFVNNCITTVTVKIEGKAGADTVEFTIPPTGSVFRPGAFPKRTKVADPIINEESFPVSTDGWVLLSDPTARDKNIIDIPEDFCA